jgi:very-short-patch-repair endonuclease
MSNNGFSEEKNQQIEKLEKNLKTFQEKLLQVDKRNRSVQFKKIFAKHNFDLVSLIDFYPEALEKISERVLKNSRFSLNFFYDSISGEDPDAIRGKLRQLSNNLRQIEEETGQQTAFIGFPFLQGHADDDFFVRGPLVLFPVGLEQKRQARGGGWFLNFLDSRPIFNGALIAAIKKRAELKIPEDIEEKFEKLIDELIEYDRTDVQEEFFRKITEWAKEVVPLDATLNDFELKKIPSLNTKDIEDLGIEKFHLMNYKILGNFPQADNEIFKDYTHLLKLSKSLDVGPIGDLIDVYDPDEDDYAEVTSDEIKLDETPDVELNTILDSDSSQDRVILESKRSKLVLVRGPPGTGKSQVITNLVSDALSNSKKVLVVCQKRAALDVVHQRLGKVGLDNFVVVLDKEHEDRQKMYSQLYETIQDPGYYSGGGMSVEYVSDQIDQRIKELSALGEALHKPYFGGASAHKIYSVGQSNYQPKLDLSWVGLSLDWNEVDDFLRKFSGIESLFKKFELTAHPWSGRKDFSNFGLREKSEIFDTLASLENSLKNSLLAKTPEDQDELKNQFEKYLYDPGFLKRNQKSAAKKISQLLEVPNVTDDYVKTNLQLIKNGQEFWKTLPNLLDLFHEQNQKEFYNICKNHESLKIRLDSLKESLADYEEMQDYDKKLQEFDTSIEKLLFAAKDKLDPIDNWTEIIKQEIYSYWIDVIERENQILKGNPIEEYNRNRESLAQLLESKKKIVQNTIQSKIAGSVTIPDISGRAQTPEKRGWKDFAAELKKKRRTKPVRQLFAKYSTNFLRLAPCWLASPESVSKVFPLKRNLFDLIIVDEASQLAVERALPFLYRANNVVIAGDDKQLQPFDLFQLREGEDDDYDEEVSEEKSLLDLALVRHHPIQLAWHYRSRYQDLINFSNHAFYEGLLQVAPNVLTDPKHPPIRWIQCNGMWDKRQNHEEARAVLDEIYKIWKTSKSKTPSIGVITFNDEQRDLIQAQFDKRLDTDSEFYQLYSNATEGKRIDDRPFFKNIENVQGDERDIIIFSIGYANDPEGHFSNHFGTLSKQGGQNRLNVAVTRAREEMIVVCSISPTAIKETSKNEGPRRLRQFLEYAKATSQLNKEGVLEVISRINESMAVTSEEHIPRFDSIFEEQVHKEIEKHGYSVHTQQEVSGYLIDLAVVHPDDPNRYVLGIECDGATFHSAASAKERDVMRQKFLESKGWQIERIWSRNWWRNSEQEVGRILTRIKKEIESQSKPGKITKEPEIETEVEPPKQDEFDYQQKEASSQPTSESSETDSVQQETKTEEEVLVPESKGDSSEKINNWIDDSLTLIRSRPVGIHQEDLQKWLSISDDELDELIPRLLRLEDISHEEITLGGIVVDRIFKKKSSKKPSSFGSSSPWANEIEQYIVSKNFSSPRTIQSQSSVLINFSKLVSEYPAESIDEVFERFVEGKSDSSVSFSRSVIYGFLKFKDNLSENNSSITKEQAREELSQLPHQLANEYITQEEYRKRRDELEKIIFD